MIKMMENSLETRKARVGKGKRVVSIWFVCVDKHNWSRGSHESTIFRVEFTDSI